MLFLFTKEIAYSKSSLKTLRRMPVNESVRIRSKIEQYADDPESLANNFKKLSGSDYGRLRVGDWRIIMNEQGNVLDIIKIAPRGSAYD